MASKMYPYGYKCVICGKDISGYKNLHGKHVVTKRNTVLNFHKECYEEEAKRSRLNAEK